MAKRSSKRSKPKTSQPPTAVEQAEIERDRQLKLEWLQARAAGRKPAREQTAGAKRHDAREEERLRWEHYRAVPQKHYREMSGRQAKVLNEQASTHGIPCSGPVIDLAAVVRAFHDFLAANAQRLRQVGEDPMAGESSPALERWREEKWKLAKLEREEREGRLLPADHVREMHTQLASILRGVGERLRVAHGNDAVELLDEGLDDWARIVTQWLTEESKTEQGGSN